MPHGHIWYDMVGYGISWDIYIYDDICFDMLYMYIYICMYASPPQNQRFSLSCFEG